MRAIAIAALLMLLPLAAAAPAAHRRAAEPAAGAGAGAAADRAPEEEELPCGSDEDCALYPRCRHGRPACRCQPWGSCAQPRAHGQRCSDDAQCAGRMLCNDTAAGGPRACSCGDGARYSRALGRCLAMPDFLTDPPRFADLPDPDRGDVDLPSIPATYVGPYLVGFISLGLVVGCLTMALWCRFSNLNEPPCPVHLCPADVCAARCRCGPTDKPDADSVPLEMLYVPPPKMYRSPAGAAAAAGPSARRAATVVTLAPGARLDSRSLHAHTELLLPPGGGRRPGPLRSQPLPPPPPPPPPPPARLSAEQWAALASLLTPAERRALEGLLVAPARTSPAHTPVPPTPGPAPARGLFIR